MRFWELKYVLVTVGSTKFDDLVLVASHERTRVLLRRLGFEAILLQIGRTQLVPEAAEKFFDGGEVNLPRREEKHERDELLPVPAFYYAYSDQFNRDLSRASLVIGHGGAGTTFEALRLSRAFISVPNPALMGNHQRELAGALARRRVLYSTPVGEVYSLLARLHASGYVVDGVVLFGARDPAAVDGAALPATRVKKVEEEVRVDQERDGADHNDQQPDLDGWVGESPRNPIYPLRPFGPEAVKHGDFARALASQVKLSVEAPRRAWVVLGSGGHTQEMVKMLRGVPAGVLAPRFLIAKTDLGSEAKLTQLEVLRAKGSKPFDISYIPRAREVHQSWFSSFFMTLWSLLFCLALALRDYPSLVIVNGPGTCVPPLLAVWLLRFVFLWRRPFLVYIESVARVDTLSFAGKILYPLVHRFYVQWPTLGTRRRKAECLGVLL